MGAAGVLSFVANAIVQLFKHSPVTMEDTLTILLIMCVGLILLAFNLPFIFKLGVEKGRIIFLIIIAVTVFAMMMAGDKIKLLLEYNFMQPALLTAAAVFIAVLVNVVSLSISNSFYKKKAF